MSPGVRRVVYTYLFNLGFDRVCGLPPSTRWLAAGPGEEA